MPIFDYECPLCGQRTEDVLVRRSDEEVMCSTCNVRTQKLPSMPAIKSLDTSEKISASLKKRSLRHSRKNKDEAVHNYRKQIGKVKKTS